ncbi:MAG TPA: M14 family zinc carboxypeptidase, partial [Chitinophagaceae bacterium]|nr:M14 family zinc carboxypeptidase [Chitinophagaceae bacterium]
MKRLILCLLLIPFFVSSIAQTLDYYLPKNVTYNAAIPTPKSVIYHEVGEWHVTHDRLVSYMKAIDAASDRVTLQITGFTYEGRPQLALIITSPENHKNLESIRQQHLALSDPSKSASMSVDNMPDVVWMGYSIHGNESSGANASLLAAYYLAAAQGSEIDDLLKNTVILIDPSFNPDGLNRFATWANMHKSATMVADPAAREFNEVWPGGRFNHYWFDLNRDWLPAQHIESKNRLAFYHQWRPNVFTDHHEMGSNASFFFQPGVPSRANPNTPLLNQELTGKIGNFHARYLDSIGSLYFTQEGYDDFYYGKGSTYPDINGGIGILFEQASSRGHAQETESGLLTFPFTIRNQFTTTLSTLAAAKSLRKELLTFQKNFYADVQKEAVASTVKSYVFGDATDKSRTYHFLDILLRHGIEVYEAKSAVTGEGKSFAPGTSYIVPTNQSQYKVIKTIFEKTLEYKDSLFYDVTAWTFPLAFNLPYAAVTTSTAAMQGNKVTSAVKPTGSIKGGQSNYAYLFSWEDFYAPKLLYQLQTKGLLAKVATQKLDATTSEGAKKFDYGSILINVKGQTKTPQEVHAIINEAVMNSGVTVYSI